jgi:phage recombination protein Bet
MSKQIRSENPFFTPEQKSLLVAELQGASEFDIERFLITCERTGLDPFAKQVYGHLQNKRVKTGKESWGYVKALVIITSIDGFRAIAERSGGYRGQTPPEWYYVDDEGKNDWHDVFITPRDKSGNPMKVPDACRVGVLRENFAAPCYGVANFQSFAKYSKDDNGAYYLDTFWKKMPEHMIAKVAEAQAIRKAFPLLACGLFVEEEVGRGDYEEEIIPPTRTDGDPLPEGQRWVEGHSPEERAAKAHAIASGPQEPAKPPVEPSTPPAEQTAPSEAPAKAGRKSRAAKEAPETPAEKPAPVEQPKAPGNAVWENYKIEQITIAKYIGKTLAELTPANIKDLYEGWVLRYADKIMLNPA